LGVHGVDNLRGLSEETGKGRANLFPGRKRSVRSLKAVKEKKPRKAGRVWRRKRAQPLA